jgi:hypothetical protein
MNVTLHRFTEDLGFERKHTVNNDVLRLHVLELNGQRVDLFTSEHEGFKDVKEGIFAMRVNVREFDEALSYYLNLGYQMHYQPMHTESCDFVRLTNADGDCIFLFHHIRKGEV